VTRPRLWIPGPLSVSCRDQLCGTGVRASPAIRSRAAQLGIDLAAVIGTGPGGAITGGDLSLLARHKPPPSGYERLVGIRRAMAEALARSVSVIPATVTEEADVSGWTSAPDITIRLVRAIVAGCRAAPALNAWFDGEQAARRLHNTIDLGLAVNTADGLFVPVLRDVATRGDDDLREALEHLKQSVATRTIAPRDLTGQTITLSNFGMIGGLYAHLTVAAPQVAILGAGRVHKAARVIADQVQIRTVMPLSLTFDHRCVTGAEAVTFLRTFKQTLEAGSSRMETQQ
jgi:2-oxoisovalerate dehydrogenase E2 component (dihydrolipoyl transacylase)